jgi:hypothetical protein
LEFGSHSHQYHDKAQYSILLLQVPALKLSSLFGLGNSDRFSPGFAVMRCILNDKPWNCHPSNALEELLWMPKLTELFPNVRWFDSFWMKELNLQADSTNLLWQ